MPKTVIADRAVEEVHQNLSIYSLKRKQLYLDTILVVDWQRYDEHTYVRTYVRCNSSLHATKFDPIASDTVGTSLREREISESDTSCREREKHSSAHAANRPQSSLRSSPATIGYTCDRMLYRQHTYRVT